MESFKANSDRSREAANEKPKIEKVTQGEATTRKATWLSKKVDSLTNNEATDRLGGLVTRSLSDMFCQGVRIVADFFCDAISIKMTNEPMSRERGRGGRASYRQYYDGDRSESSGRAKASVSQSWDDIVYPTRGDAEMVLSEMEDLLDNFKVVSVADMFDLAGVSSSYTDNKYGWTDLRDAYVERCRDGYMIRLPRATNL